MKEILEEVRGSREDLRARMAHIDKGYLIDGNEDCARRSVNAAALDFLGAEKLVRLVLWMAGQGLTLSPEEVQALSEQLKVNLSHPEFGG